MRDRTIDSEVGDRHLIRLVMHITPSGHIELRIRIFELFWLSKQRVEGWTTRHNHEMDRITDENLEESIRHEVGKAAEIISRREHNKSVIDELEVTFG